MKTVKRIIIIAVAAITLIGAGRIMTDRQFCKRYFPEGTAVNSAVQTVKTEKYRFERQLSDVKDKYESLFEMADK